MVSRVVVQLTMGLALRSGASWSVALGCRQADGEIIAYRRERFHRYVATTLDGPLLGLVHQDRADEASYGCLVWKDPDHIGAACDLAIQTFDGVRGMQLGAVLLSESHVGQGVLLGSIHKRRKLRQLGPHLIGHQAPLCLGGCMIGLGEGRGDMG